MKIDVLDHGFVELLDTMGDDLTIVNAARVSFGKRKEKFDFDDEQLLRYLAKHKHHSPYRHVYMQFHVKAPEVVMRQWYKHVVGVEYTAAPVKDHAWNEISGRYIKRAENYSPDIWRKQHPSSKQASSGPIPDDITQRLLSMRYEEAVEALKHFYEFALEKGVAKEQARLILPFSFYTEVWWTASFQALMNFMDQRDKPDAQWEIQQYAKAIGKMVEEKFPFATRSWRDNIK